MTTAEQPSDAVEPELVESALSQRVTRNGQSVQVDIYGVDPGEWTLEIIDENNCSHVWTDTFPTAQAALDEALKTIDEEGIDSLLHAQDDID